MLANIDKSITAKISQSMPDRKSMRDAFQMLALFPENNTQNPALEPIKLKNSPEKTPENKDKPFYEMGLIRHFNWRMGEEDEAEGWEIWHTTSDKDPDDNRYDYYNIFDINYLAVYEYYERNIDYWGLHYFTYGLILEAISIIVRFIGSAIFRGIVANSGIWVANRFCNLWCD